MAVGLECRAPILDHRVVSLAFGLPESQRVRGGEGKWALRAILDGYLPRELLDRPKAGFSVPISEWFRRELADWTDDRLSPANLAATDFVDPSVVQRVLREHKAGRVDHGRLIWALLMLQVWMEHVTSEGR
jgi:asparagine synthase (glutamine-hydrolysing)